MGNPLRDLAQHLHRLLTRPLQELSLWQRGVAFSTRLAIHCGVELRRDKAPQVAAALAYHTLFSLVPMLVLGFLVVGSLRGLEVYSDRFQALILDLLLPDNLLERDAVGVIRAGQGQVEFDIAREALRDRLEWFLTELSQVSFTGVSIVGVTVFVYGATSLLGTIERSFDSIYRAERKRPQAIRLPLYFTLITFGPVILVGSQIMQDQWLDRLSATHGFAWLVGPFFVLSPLLASWLIIFIAFRTLPNTYVQLRAAVIGSLVAATGWLALQELLGIYAHSAAVTGLYGALALLPILLLWIYLSWLIVLFGLELTYSLQHLAADKFGADPLHPPLPGDPRWLVPIVSSIAQAFKNGETRSRPELAGEIGVSPTLLTPFLERLEEAGILLEIEQSANAPRRFTLARPPESIYLREVLRLSERPRSSEGPGWAFLSALEKKAKEETDQATIASLLE